ncbi:MAG: DUF1517 domain-containing protein [Pleurocapsa minor HA4230-MV1]|jgi:uncharacterized membrane protein|nr:DUF1517 domain-containing protein [Pleurocapsa minor HA4230-MV1]
MVNQKKASKSNLLLSTFFAFTLLNITDLPIQANFLNSQIDFSQQVLAKRSGGRSGGGSFRSRSSSSSNTTRRSRSSRGKNHNNTVIIHNSSYHRAYGHGGDINLLDLLFFLVFFGIFGCIAYTIYAQNQVSRKVRKRESREETELKNRQVTISKLHIALTAEAIAISKQLSQLTLSIDTNTQQGLIELLQESMIILLRNSEHWTHISSRSFPIKMDKAEAAFNRLSIAQRSKFSCETVSNINGKIRDYTDETRNESHNQANDNLNLPAYVVVTILIGSAGEEPLFHRIHSCEELKLTLEKLAVISEDDLMKLEVLWTPQSEDEPLTNDEFILEHPDMIQLG